ncbi:MAG: hypothetical protein ABJ388_11665 [Alphaproteobacteria bacterium]
MEHLYHGFDGLDVAFQGRVPPGLLPRLEDAQEQARKDMREPLITYNGVAMMVAESGARGGYAFRCDTGPDGATWFFKRPKPGDPWGVRVSVKSLALALYGLGGVRARLYATLDALGIAVPPGGESIGRVDYAVDVLEPGFILVPENFVMHSHTSRADHIEPEPLQRHGTSGRVTSVTVGKMPNRQVIVYDKRREVLDRHKVHWWEIWNACRERAGCSPLNPEDRGGSQVWRVEIRAGKECLKKAWGGKKWADLDNHFAALVAGTLKDIRYAVAGDDSNRSRWPDHALWGMVRSVTERDLFEMACEVLPDLVKAVIRKEHIEMTRRQILGLSANFAAGLGIKPDDAQLIPDAVERCLKEDIAMNEHAFAEKIIRASARYQFLETT